MRNLSKIYRKLLENEDQKIRPTVEWMEENYAKMNKEVFNNELGDCRFEIFTTGKGSNGGVLGWFTSDTDDSDGQILVDKSSRQMVFLQKILYDRKAQPIYRNNFVELFKPIIKINGNYVATEEALLNTLVHEMVHYYNYMNGKCPRQGHGVEFKNACRMVERQSNGRFEIKRVASAEMMQNWELDKEIKDKNDRRLKNKKSKVSAYFVFLTNGDVKLTLTSNDSVVSDILRINRPPVRWDGESCAKIVKSDDFDLIDKLFSRGYTRNFRTYKSYRLPEDLKDIVFNYDWSIIFDREKQIEEEISEEKYIELVPEINYGLESPFELEENI